MEHAAGFAVAGGVECVGAGFSLGVSSDHGVEADDQALLEQPIGDPSSDDGHYRSVAERRKASDCLVPVSANASSSRMLR